MAKRIIINESMFRRLVKEMTDWPMDAELDRNMNVFDDQSVANAYAAGDDVSYINGTTLRDRMKNDETGTGVDYSDSDDEITSLIAEITEE